MQSSYNALTNTTDCVQSDEVINRVQHAKAPLLRTSIDQSRIYSAIASTNTTVAANKTAASHPHAAVLNLSAVQAGKKTASDLTKIKAAAANPHADVLDVGTAQQCKRAQNGVDQLTAVAEAVDSRVQTLESGLLVSNRAYSTNADGGCALTITPATDPVQGGHASLQTFDGSGGVTASITLSNTGVSVEPALSLPASNISDVGAYIKDVKDELTALKIQNDVETAADAAIEAAQSGAIASLLAKVFPPAGYTALDPELDPDPDDVGQEDNTQSLLPLTLVRTWSAPSLVCVYTCMFYQD